MADVTSGFLSKNTAARYQLTAERFPVGKSATRDYNDGDDSSETGARWKMSGTEDGCPYSGDISTTAQWNGNGDRGALTDGAGCWGNGQARQSDVNPGAGLLISRDKDFGGLERLAADSAVGRLVLMIQRLTDTNQRHLPAVSHLYQATPPPMTSSGDVTCHVASPSVGSSKEDYSEHVESRLQQRCSQFSCSPRSKDCLRRQVPGTPPDDDVSQTNMTSLGFEHHHHQKQQQQQQRLIKCRHCPFSTKVREEFWMHSRVHIRRERMLSCPKCPFVTEFKHHLEYHLRNHVGSKPFRCTRCDYACVNRSMLNSHAKSHVNVYQYRCADCAYASKYCHSLKLHLRKHGHRPAAVLNPDGSLPTDGSDHAARRGPPHGPRTAPPPPSSRRKLSIAGVERAWSAEAQVVTSVMTSEVAPGSLTGDSCWPLEEFRLAATATSPESPVSRDPYAFIADEDTDCLSRQRVDVGKRLAPMHCADDVVGRCVPASTVDDRLPATKRRRNAEFIARLTANIEAELVADDRPLDLTAKSTSADVAVKDGGSVATVSVDARPDQDGSAASSPSSSDSSDVSRGARRRKGIAQRRADVVNGGYDVIGDAVTLWSSGPTTAVEDVAAGRAPTDRRGFVECRHCRIGFRDRVTYSLHMGYHGFDAPFSCNMCGHQAADRVEFFVHIATAAH